MSSEKGGAAATQQARGLWDDAEVIHRYTRAEAIADGTLVDVSEVAREAGFRVPVAMTRTLWADTVEWDPTNDAPQDEAGRLWDVLWMAWNAARRRSSAQVVEVEVLRVRNRPHESTPQLVRFIAHCGPGDEAEPVVTLMFPGEE